MKKNGDLIERLHAAGVKPDMRQDGWPLIFATFAVTDWQHGDAINKLCIKSKEDFIHAAPSLSYSSALASIVFCPYVTTAPSALKKELSVSHRRSEMAAVIKANFDPELWNRSNASKRRELFFGALLSGISSIKDAWLSADDKAAISSVFMY